MWKKLITVAVILLVGGFSFWFSQKQQNRMIFVTEEYPPYNFTNESGEVVGLATEVVQEIMKRQGIEGDMSMMLWKDAYDMATTRKNVAIFSIRRTASREDIFHWIGPIGTTKNIFYAKKDSGLTFENLEEVKSVSSVGVIAEWFSTQNLVNEGFENLVTVSTPNEVVHKLMDGEVDVVALTDVSIKKYMEEAGYRMDDIEQVLWVDGGYDYIGLSSGTSEEIVNKWKATMNELTADGTLEKIHNEYRPGEALGDLL